VVFSGVEPIDRPRGNLDERQFCQSIQGLFAPKNRGVTASGRDIDYVGRLSPVWIRRAHHAGEPQETTPTAVPTFDIREVLTI
jgi:hypothetical protein